MNKLALLLIAAGLATTSPSFSAADKPIRSTANGAPVVRVNATNQFFDFGRPWEKRNPFPRRGTGAILGGGRVLVTAEMVANNNFLELEKPRTGEKIPARLLVVDYDANLALLEPTDPAFLEGLGAFLLDNGTRIGDSAEILQVESNGEIARTPATLTTISVSPYPLESLSLLTFRLSSPLQSRDSSFVLPAERNGRLLGLLMRYDSRTQTADLVPAPIIADFLRRVETEPFVGPPKAGVAFASTRDPQLRRFLELERPGGVYVTDVVPDSPAAEAGIQRGDVILSVAGRDIDDDGLYDDPNFGKILFTHLVTSSHSEKPLPFKLWRDGSELTVEVTPASSEASDAVSPVHTFDQAPRHLVLGGLVFQELSRSFLREWGGNWRKSAPQRLVYLDAFQSELPKDQNRIVFLSAILPSDDTIGYEGLENLVVTNVNNRQIRSLDDLLEATKHPINGFHRIEFEEDPGFIFLDADQIKLNQPRLSEHYGIPKMHNLQ